LLPAGPTPPNPAELLGSQRMRELLGELDRFADIVIIDTPPLLAVTDAAALASEVDAVILVTAVKETHRGAAKRAQELIANANAKFFSVVLNKVDASAEGYYRYYDYYGTSDEKRKGRRARKYEGKHAKARA
jgi:capsular exopolysaccharide synthesis family protein